MAILSAQMGKNPGIYSVSMRRFLQKTIFRVLVGIRNFYVILILLGRPHVVPLGRPHVNARICREGGARVTTNNTRARGSQ